MFLLQGLLTGHNLSGSRRSSGELCLVPKQMLKSDEAIMLDGMSMGEVANRDWRSTLRSQILDDLAEFLT